MSNVFRAILSISVAAGLCLSTQNVRAELWPPLDKYVQDCVLIVKCVTDDSDVYRYKVLETWKGVYSPDLFHRRPPDGFIHASSGHGNTHPTAGREIVFFFTEHNQPSSGKLRSHSTAFPIRNGTIVYASTSFGLRKEYSVEAFKAAVTQIVKDQAKAAARPPGAEEFILEVNHLAKNPHDGDQDEPGDVLIASVELTARQHQDVRCKLKCGDKTIEVAATIKDLEKSKIRVDIAYTCTVAMGSENPPLRSQVRTSITCSPGEPIAIGGFVQQSVGPDGKVTDFSEKVVITLKPSDAPETR